MSLPTSALISVFDKTGLEPLAKAFEQHGIAMISSGGTYKHLKSLGFGVREVSDVTGFPEILDGRVKTLHPNIHGGLLARRDDPVHMATIKDHDIDAIDILVSNLYPFEQTLASGAAFAECVEQIDVGGPAMIRAAAKNHEGVLVITSIRDYADLIERLSNPATIDASYRRTLAQRAFAHTSAYDSAINSWLAGELGEPFPPKLTTSANLAQTLRYGENPHQKAAFYKQSDTGLASAELIQGKQLSYNNIADADAAWSLIHEFDKPAIAIIKHANPCGCAEGTDLLDAYKKALKADPVSAFGGIVAANRPLDIATAEAITQIFTEVVIVPSIEAGVADIFAKKPNLRLLIAGNDKPLATPQLKSVAGGILVQDADTKSIDTNNFKTVTERQPTKAEIDDMEFAFKVARHVKSNAIVLARDRAVIGVGAGQMNRLDSVKIAASRAEQHGLKGPCVLASDAFFPFKDGLEQAVDAGITAAIQPGGSMRDDEVIDFANEAQISMMLTGQRHFWH